MKILKKAIQFIVSHRAFDLAAIFALSIFCYRGWFRGGIIEYGDWSYLSRDFLMDGFTFPLCWTSRFFAGQGFMLYGWPIQWLMGLVAHLGFDYGVAERVAYFFPYVFLSVVGIYYFTYTLFKNRITCFFSTLFYIFNVPTLMIVAGGVISRMIAYALLPLAVVFFIKAEKQGKFINSLIAGIILNVMIFYESRVAYQAVGVIFLFFLASLWQVISLKEQVFKKVVMQFLYLCVALVTLVILNFYWIYPTLMAKASYMVSGYNLSGVVSALSYFKLSHALAVYLPWWPSGAKPGVLFYLAPFLAFTAIIFRPKDSNVRLLTFLAVISVLITMGTNPPLGKLYIWLFKHFPGFDAFRDPGKFYTLICFAYAPLLGVSMDAISLKIKKMGFKMAGRSFTSRHLNAVFLLVIFSIFIYLSWPAFEGKLGGVLSSHPMPKEYKKIESFIKNQEGSFRTFWRPHVGRFVFYSDKFPAFCSGKTSAETRFFFGEQWDQNVFNRSKYVAKILGLLNIKYCFIPLEPNIISWMGKDKNFYLSSFQDKEGLKKIDIGEGIEAFENGYFAPKFFGVASATLVVGSKRALLDLADFKNLDLSKFAVFFSDELKSQTAPLLPKVDSAIFYDTEIDDLVLNSVPDQYRIDLARYATTQDETVRGTWSQVLVAPTDTFGYLYGVISQSPGGLILAYDNWGHAELARPIKLTIDRPGIFEVWIRAMKGPNMDGTLDIWFSNSQNSNQPRINILNDKVLKDGNFYLQWIKAGEIELDRGSYSFDIGNKNGNGALDQLIVIPKKDIESLRQQTLQALKSKAIIIFKNCYSLPVDISVTEAGKYNLIASISKDNLTCNVDLSVNGQIIRSINLDQPEESSHTEMAEVEFYKGRNQIALSKTGPAKIKLKKLILYKSDKPVSSLEEILVKADRIPVEWKMFNPTRYEVKFKNDAPAFLIFSEAFDPRWQLEINQPVNSVSAYGMLNSFFIDSAGEVAAAIDFSPQRYVYQGLWLSAAGFVIILAFLFQAGISFLRRKKLKDFN